MLTMLATGHHRVDDDNDIAEQIATGLKVPLMIMSGLLASQLARYGIYRVDEDYAGYLLEFHRFDDDDYTGQLTIGCLKFDDGARWLPNGFSGADDSIAISQLATG